MLFRSWHRFMNYRSAAKRATRLVSVSKSTKRDLEKIYNIPASKIQVIYPGVNFEEGADAGLGDFQEKYFLYFGTFEPRKNLDCVLEAYREYCKITDRPRQLVLAGSHGWKVRLEIPNKLKNLVHIKRKVSEEEKNELYRGAYALLFLSFYEGFGFPVLEAASQGVPVIAASATSLAEIGENFVLFANPFRSSQVAGAMCALEQDQVLYETLKSQGLKEVEKFTWATTARKTLQLFEEVSLCV